MERFLPLAFGLSPGNVKLSCYQFLPLDIFPKIVYTKYVPTYVLIDLTDLFSGGVPDFDGDLDLEAASSVQTL